MTNGSKQTGSAASPDRSAVADEKLKLNLRPVFKRVDPLWPGIGFELFYSTGAWLIGPFVEAWVRVNGESDDAKREARTRFLMPIMEHLNHAGLGHV